MPRLGLGLGLAKGSVLYSFFGTIISNFISRVTADGGTFEAQTCLQNYLNSLGQNLYDKASLIITPNAYKASKIYSLKPTNGSGDLTFARASARTRRNSSGVIESLANNVPALEYPASGCPAWSFEVQRTNICIRSAEFNNSIWIQSAGVDVNAALAPDGTINADNVRKFSTGLNSLYQNYNYTTTGLYTESIFAKANTSNFIQFSDGTSPILAVNLVTGAVTASTGVVSNVNVESYGNGWFRISYVRNRTSTGTSTQLYFWPSDRASLSFSTTSSTCSCFVWGAQVELGSYATSYIPTTTASVTRVVDAASVTGISSLIGQAEGTWYTEFTTGTVVPSNGDIIGNNSGATNNIFFGVLSGNLRVYIYYNTSFIFFNIPIAANTRYKCALRYKSGDSKLYVNGTPYSDTTAFAFTASLDGLVFLDDAISGPRVASSYGANMFFLSALSDAELQTLTT